MLGEPGQMPSVGAGDTDKGGGFPIMSSFNQLDWREEREDGLTMLGVPICRPNDTGSTRLALTALVDGFEASLHALGRLPDPQIQLRLLRVCLDACRLNHVFRAADCTGLTALVSRASGALRGCLEGVTGFSLSDNQWSQASLPTARGGFGISDPIQVCHAARLSACVSWISGGAVGLTLCPVLRDSLPRGHVGVIAALCSVLGNTGEPLSVWAGGETYKSQDPKHASQSFWSNLLVKSQRDQLVASVSARDRARLEIQDHPEAVSWVTASPAIALGNDCSPSAFRLLMRWHLGEPIIPREWVGVACPGCGDSLDAFGDHAVCCAKGGWWARHFTVQEFILQDCRAAGLPCAREKIIDPTTLQRPADLWFPRWDGLTDLAVDVTVRHPCAPGVFSGDSVSAFSSLHKAETEKQAKYSRACAKQGCDFEPLVLSTWGRGTPKGEALLRKIHKKGHLDLQNRPQAEAFREFRESLGMRLALRVAAQLEQATRLAVARVDAEVDEFGNMTRFSALPVKRLTGCVPGSPPPAKRRQGATPPVGGTGNRAQQGKPGKAAG